MSVASLLTINSINTVAYDDPLCVRIKSRYMKKNHGKQLHQRTPLSLRRAMLVQAAYVKLQGIAGLGNMVTLSLLEKIHPSINFNDLDTIKQCTNSPVREVMMDFLSVQGPTETITKEAFMKYYECMSFYVSVESSFERHMMTVYALSPVDVVTMASRRLDESIATSHLRSSFSSTGSVRSLVESYNSDRENEPQCSNINRSSSPAMPTPPRTSKRASSTHSLRSKSFTESTSSSVSDSNKEVVKVVAMSDLTDHPPVTVGNGSNNDTGGIGIAGINTNQRNNKPSYHRSFDSSSPRAVGDGIDDGGLRALMDSVYNSGGRRTSGGRSKIDDSPKKRRPSITSSPDVTTSTTVSSSSAICTTTAGYCTDGSAVAAAAREPLSRRGLSSPSLLRDRNGEIKIVEVVARGSTQPRPMTGIRKESKMTMVHTSPSSSSKSE